MTNVTIFGDMIRKGVFIVGTMIISMILFILWGLIWAWPLTWAWNFLVPDVFGLSEITYWQMWLLYLIIASFRKQWG